MNKGLLIATLAVLCLLPSLSSAKNADDGFLSLARTTEEIWNHHIKSFGDHNLEEILSDYSDDSFMIVNNNVISGREKLSVAFEQLFKLFGNGVQTMIGYTIKENIIFITWNFAPNNDSTVYFGTDSFVIVNGKIQTQTIASTLYDTYPITG